jgi:hypothetical protein
LAGDPSRTQLALGQQRRFQSYPARVCFAPLQAVLRYSQLGLGALTEAVEIPGVSLMLANLVVFLSASVAALTLLDLLLSDVQKKAVADRVTGMWNWLDEVSGFPF